MRASRLRACASATPTTAPLTTRWGSSSAATTWAWTSCRAGGPAPPGTPLQQAGALTWDQRYLQIKALVDAGFANRIMLGNDHSIAMSIQPTEGERLRLAQYPDGILFVSRKALPALRTIGVGDAAIRAMTIESHRRFFAEG